MDEMRIKLSTKFMKGIVSKLISRAIYKQCGCKVSIRLNDLDVWVIDGDTNIKTNVEIQMNNAEFTKLMKQIDEG